MTIEPDIIVGPSHFASALVNGDWSGMEDPADRAACKAWVESIRPWRIVATTDAEPWFTWSYRLYGGAANGGEVIEYIVHQQV
jgi:hypothetical protein